MKLEKQCSRESTGSLHARKAWLHPIPHPNTSTVAFSRPGWKMERHCVLFQPWCWEAEDCPSSKPWQNKPYIAGCALVWVESSSLFTSFQYKRIQGICLIFFFPSSHLSWTGAFRVSQVFVCLIFWFWRSKRIFAFCFSWLQHVCFHIHFRSTVNSRIEFSY